MKKFLVIFFLLSLVFTSCNLFELSKPVIQANGLTQDINSLVPQTTIDAMKNLGMPINSGDTPPILGSGSTGVIYKASPFILKSSNRAGDVPGHQFADYYVKFYNQNNTKLTLTLDYSNGGETGTGLGSFIVGTGNAFTVFAQVNSTTKGYSAVLVHVISGTLTSTGIQNLYFANFMVDNKGNAGNVWINNGEGRVIYDSDGNSPIVTSYSAVQAQKSPGLSSGNNLKLY